LNIFNIGYSADTTVTRFGPGVRNSYITHYVISGKGQFNGHSVCSGQGFLITPGMEERYFPDKEDPWEFVWFVSNDPIMKRLFPSFGADENTCIFHYDYVHVLKELASFLTAHNHKIYGGFEMLEIFLKVFKHQPAQILPPANKSNAETYLDAAEKYIVSNLHHPITVSELTEFLGVSQPYLFKIFKDRFSSSPKQYILSQKLIRAQMLLRESNMSITHIANSVGFPDVLSFSKFFHSKLSISPQTYRSEVKNKKA
jgi:AraC-like DNA-binding protein